MVLFFISEHSQLQYISHAAEIEVAPPPEEQAEPQHNQKNIFSWARGSQVTLRHRVNLHGKACIRHLQQITLPRAHLAVLFQDVIYFRQNGGLKQLNFFVFFSKFTTDFTTF